MVTCEIDGKEFANGGVLARHLKKEYGLTYKEYYHKHIIKTDKIPTCKCGCGKEMRFKGTSYTEFAKGHYSRVHNNWGHNPKAVQNSADTRREQFKNGEREVWNKGLTMEDERVANNLKSLIDESRSETGRKNRSEKMKNQWKTSNITPLKAENHPQWKGGSSQIQQLARADRTLYTDWKLPILKRDNFQCVECGCTDNLHVHHDNTTFSEIIQIVMSDNQQLAESLKFEDKRLLADKVVQYHINHQISGETLCDCCHNKLHPSLNFGG